MKKTAFLLFFLLSLSCENDSSQNPSYGSDKEITSFSFPSSINGALTENYTGFISGNVITFYLPFGTSLDGLKASFTTTGNRVTVNDTDQEPNVTPNNFLDPVVYSVYAEDGSKMDYSVVVNLRFTDYFNRGNSTNVGNGWHEIEQGSSPASNAEIYNNELKLTGGNDSSPVNGQAVITRNINISSNFTITFSAKISAGSQVLAYCFPGGSATNSYVFAIFSGRICIYRDTTELAEENISFIDSSHYNDIEISISNGVLILSITDNTTSDSAEITANDNSYNSFSAITICGGWYSSGVVSDYIDDFLIETVK